MQTVEGDGGRGADVEGVDAGSQGDPHSASRCCQGVAGSGPGPRPPYEGEAPGRGPGEGLRPLGVPPPG